MPSSSDIFSEISPLVISIIHGGACFAYFNKIWGIPSPNGLASSSHATWEYVAINLSVCADKNNAVPGRISRVPFQLLIGDGDFGAVRDFALTVRDNRDVMVLIDLEEISFVSVGLTAT